MLGSPLGPGQFRNKIQRLTKIETAQIGQQPDACGHFLVRQMFPFWVGVVPQTKSGAERRNPNTICDGCMFSRSVPCVTLELGAIRQMEPSQDIALSVCAPILGCCCPRCACMCVRYIYSPLFTMICVCGVCRKRERDGCLSLSHSEQRTYLAIFLIQFHAN